MNKPFSQACANNQQPILDILRRYLPENCDVLEVGSGTGQHAVHFCRQWPTLRWQTSDLRENHAGIRQWVNEASLANCLPPLELDVSKDWPEHGYDSIFSANTLHIMPWSLAPMFFQGAGGCLVSGGLLVVYGPFNYEGRYTSDSNAQFDQWLAARNPHSAIRHFEAVNELALAQGLVLQADESMPANNRCLVWEKRS